MGVLGGWAFPYEQGSPLIRHRGNRMSSWQHSSPQKSYSSEPPNARSPINTPVRAKSQLPPFRKLTNTFAAWFVVTGDVTPDGVCVVRSVLGATSSLPIVAFRQKQSCVAKSYSSEPPTARSPISTPVRNDLSVGPYSRPMPRGLRWS